jgi:hypothetical protein
MMTAEEMKSILLLSDDVSSVRIVSSPEADCVRKNGIYDYYQHVNECDYIVPGKTEYGPGVCFDYMERGKCSREGCTFYEPHLMLAWRDGHLQVHMAVRDVTCWDRVLESYMETKEFPTALHPPNEDAERGSAAVHGLRTGAAPAYRHREHG